MSICVGILHVPDLDEFASKTIREELHRRIPMLAIILENSVESQRNWIEYTLERWCDEEELDLIITIGGTQLAPGPSSMEVVPDATLAVVERQLPGISETMRRYAQKESRLALLERGIAGIRGRTLILNLPAHAAPALLFFEAIVDLIEPAVAYLQQHLDSPTMSDVLEIDRASTIAEDKINEPDRATHQLDPGEFAAFLARSKTD